MEEGDDGGDFAEGAGEADTGEEEDAAAEAGGVVAGAAARAEEDGDAKEGGGGRQDEGEDGPDGVRRWLSAENFMLWGA